MAADERTTRELKRAAVLAHEYGVDFRIADLIARAELEREGKLVDALFRLEALSSATGRHPDAHALERDVRRISAAATSAYESEFAPPKRTLAQVAADALVFLNNQSAIAIELAEALRREGGECG